MRVSLDLSREDVALLDDYANAHALPSRSAVVQQAIGALRLGDLGDAYGKAWDEWSGSRAADLWETTADDKL